MHVIYKVPEDILVKMFWKRKIPLTLQENKKKSKNKQKYENKRKERVFFVCFFGLLIIFLVC
jgi:hypothetical protein